MLTDTQGYACTYTSGFLNNCMNKCGYCKKHIYACMRTFTMHVDMGIIAMGK